jgi:hypothetical protein
VIQALGSAGDAVGRGGRGGRPERSGALGAVDERIIIDERNDAVIDELAHHLAARVPPRAVAIFYGAAHMEDFEKTLRERWGLLPTDVVWSAAMGVDEWSEKRIRDRVCRSAGRVSGVRADRLAPRTTEAATRCRADTAASVTAASSTARSVYARKQGSNAGHPRDASDAHWGCVNRNGSVD